MADVSMTEQMSSSRRNARRRSLAVASGFIVASAGFVTLALGAADTDGLVGSAFDRAMARIDMRQSAVLAEVVQSGQRQFDGIAGSEAYWLGVGDPDIIRTFVVGRAVTIGSGGSEKRLVVTDIRASDDAGAGLSDETTLLDPHFVPALPSKTGGAQSAASQTWLIVCRDSLDPDAGELLLRLQNGRLTLVSSSGDRSL